MVKQTIKQSIKQAQLNNQNQLSLPAKIKRKQQRLEYLKTHSKNQPKWNNKLSKLLQVKVYVCQKELLQMRADLEALKISSDKIVVSEKLEMFFKLAKIFKPWLTEEIDDLLKK